MKQRATTVLAIGIAIGGAAVIAFALDEGQLARTDDQGKTYYEIRARNPNGNTGGSVPVYGGTSPARHITIRAESYWRVADGENGASIHPDGSGRPKPSDMAGFKAPNLKPWALIGRWQQFNQDPSSSDFGNATNIGEFFEIDAGGTFDVPVFAPDAHKWVVLRYYCNDEDYSDNTGWLHVYESYAP
jgi:hypothetical protein